MDYRDYNRQAWDAQVENGNQWTLPVGPQVIAAARRGEWQVVLTPTRPVPASWFPPMAGCRVLCLASGGGQQGPIFAAAGAKVTVLDNSPRQLLQDRLVANREGLTIETVEGDMRDLSAFPDKRFDFIFHPVSNAFVPEVLPIWKEAFRVLCSGGILLAGFVNPLIYIFDLNKLDEGELEVKYCLPYSDAENLSDAERVDLMAKNLPFEFSHSLEEEIGGQMQAGFLLTGLFEDIDPTSILGKYLPTFIATRAVRP